MVELSEIQVESGLSRLEKLKLIRISKAGVVTDATSGRTTNITPFSTTFAKRNLQKQFLEKAIKSIDHDPLTVRDMAERLTSGRKSNRTYNMSIALYPLSKDIKECL